MGRYSFQFPRMPWKEKPGFHQKSVSSRRAGKHGGLFLGSQRHDEKQEHAGHRSPGDLRLAAVQEQRESRQGPHGAERFRTAGGVGHGLGHGRVQQKNSRRKTGQQIAPRSLRAAPLQKPPHHEKHQAAGRQVNQQVDHVEAVCGPIRRDLPVQPIGQHQDRAHAVQPEEKARMETKAASRAARYRRTAMPRGGPGRRPRRPARWPPPPRPRAASAIRTHPRLAAAETAPGRLRPAAFFGFMTIPVGISHGIPEWPRAGPGRYCRRAGARGSPRSGTP